MLAAGTIINERYEILHQIGSGGMGAVYKAQDLRLQRPIAIKYMLVSPAPEYIRAFEREARLLARLDHPALPDVSDYFLERNGRFLVMEYVEGDDLGQLINRRERFELATVMRWCDTLLDAVAYLHAQSSPILHRDIKPQNVKITPQGEVKLLDFGLAKGSVDPLAPDTTGNSIHGYTLHYSAIEQIQAIGTDARSDLYAFAATVYHLLTGVLPPNAPTRTFAKAAGQPDPLVPIHVLNPEVPQAVSRVLGRALALDRQERPANAAQLRASLREAWRSSPPVPARRSRFAFLQRLVPKRSRLPTVQQKKPNRFPLRALQFALALLGFLALAAIAAIVRTPPIIGVSQLSAATIAIAAICALALCVVVLRNATWGAYRGTTLGSHGDVVLCVAFSPKNDLLASASRDSSIRVWRVGQARELYACKGHQGSIRRVAFTPDGSLLLSASDDGTVRLWRASDGQPLHVLRGHTAAVWSIAVSPDGSLVASAGDDTTVRLWRIEDGQLLHTMRDHRERVWNVTFSRDGRLLASAGDDATIRLWRVQDGQPLYALEGHNDYVSDIQFSPDGTLLASGSRDTTIRLWRVQDGEPLHMLKGHTLTAGGVAFHPNGTLLASRSEDTTIQMWRVRDGRPLHTLKGHNRYVSGMAFAPDGRTIASVSWDAIVHIWRVQDGRLIQRLQGHTARICDITYSADGRWLATAGLDCTVRLWNVRRL